MAHPLAAAAQSDEDDQETICSMTFVTDAAGFRADAVAKAKVVCSDEARNPKRFTPELSEDGNLHVEISLKANIAAAMRGKPLACVVEVPDFLPRAFECPGDDPDEEQIELERKDRQPCRLTLAAADPAIEKTAAYSISVNGRARAVTSHRTVELSEAEHRDLNEGAIFKVKWDTGLEGYEPTFEVGATHCGSVLLLDSCKAQDVDYDLGAARVDPEKQRRISGMAASQLTTETFSSRPTQDIKVKVVRKDHLKLTIHWPDNYLCTVHGKGAKAEPAVDVPLPELNLKLRFYRDRDRSPEILEDFDLGRTGRASHGGRRKEKQVLHLWLSGDHDLIQDPTRILVLDGGEVSPEVESSGDETFHFIAGSSYGVAYDSLTTSFQCSPPSFLGVDARPLLQRLDAVGALAAGLGNLLRSVGKVGGWGTHLGGASAYLVRLRPKDDVKVCAMTPRPPDAITVWLGDTAVRPPFGDDMELGLSLGVSFAKLVGTRALSFAPNEEETAQAVRARVDGWPETNPEWGATLIVPGYLWRLDGEFTTALHLRPRRRDLVVQTWQLLHRKSKLVRQRDPFFWALKSEGWNATASVDLRAAARVASRWSDGVIEWLLRDAGWTRSREWMRRLGLSEGEPFVRLASDLEGRRLDSAKYFERIAAVTNADDGRDAVRPDGTSPSPQRASDRRLLRAHLAAAASLLLAKVHPNRTQQAKIDDACLKAGEAWDALQPRNVAAMSISRLSILLDVGVILVESCLCSRGKSKITVDFAHKIMDDLESGVGTLDSEAYFEAFYELRGDLPSRGGHGGVQAFCRRRF